MQSGLVSRWGSSVGRGADYDPTQVRPSRPARALSNLHACLLTLLSGGGEVGVGVQMTWVSSASRARYCLFAGGVIWLLAGLTWKLKV